jgi:hypothetical protein
VARKRAVCEEGELCMLVSPHDHIMHLSVLFYDLTGELTVILITICWLQKLGKDWQQVNNQHRSLLWKDLISGS